MLKNLFLIVLFCCAIPNLNAQVLGEIYAPSTDPNNANQANPVLDPNNDGFITFDGTPFSSTATPLEENEFELNFIRFPQIDIEPNGDTNTGGSCSTVDIVSSSVTNTGHGYYYIDGTNIIFRVRMAKAHVSGKFGYSVLLDLDNAFGDGSTGTADSNFQLDNPGFEIEILYTAGSGVFVYDVDGIIKSTFPSSSIASFPEINYSQKSYAKDGDVACSSNNDVGFIDFYVPMSAIKFDANDDGDYNDPGDLDGLQADTQFRLAAGTTSSGASIISTNTAADVAGVDGNVLPDLNDAFYTSIEAGSIDNDNDGIYNQFDLDDDNDGILDSAEDANLDGDNDPTTNPTDTDGDGIYNMFDLDSDNDGIPDAMEAVLTDDYVTSANLGTMGTNGVYSGYNNGNGYESPINTDLLASGSNTNDNTPDYLDTDSDGDGIFDIDESIYYIGGDTNNPTAQLTDDNNDGRVDGAEDDNDPETVNPVVGSNGLANTYDGNADDFSDPDGLFENTIYYADSDSDAEVDWRDNALSVMDDNDDDGISDLIDLDDDNDGILDAVEDGDYDAEADEDGDGILNYEDTSDLDPQTDNGGTDYTDANADGIPDIFDTDGDGVPNHFDIDSDNDGIIDNIEADETLLIYTIPTGTLGTNGVYSDYNDGLGITPDNSDGDSLPNYLDLDSDGDGIPDNIEAQTTLGYLEPLGTISSNTSTKGLDANYVSSFGLIPVDTDGDLIPDYTDLNSDNEGGNDTTEAGLTLSGNVGQNGLDNNYDNEDSYSDVNGSFDNTQADNFDDIDSDVNDGGDVDWRDDTTTIATPGALLWLRADEGITQSTEGATVNSWVDQTAAYDAANASTGPSFQNSPTTGLNFNPTLHFDGTEALTITDGILGDGNVYSDIWVYAVFKAANTNTSYIYSETAASSKPMNLSYDGSNLSFYVYNGLDYAVGSAYTDNYQLYNYGSSTGTNTPSGQEDTYYINASQVATASTGEQIGGRNNDFYLGHMENANYFSGQISEIIIYSEVPSANEQLDMQSYLAIKYGMTLTNSNYSILDVNNQQVTLWNASENTAFHNDIAAIGKHNLKGLNQKQSKSISADALVTIGLTSIYNSNKLNVDNNSENDLTNEDFLAWGNNNGSLASTGSNTIMCDSENTLLRTWKIIETTESEGIGTVQVAATASTIESLLGVGSIFLKVADDASLTNNVEYIPMSSTDIYGNGANEYVANYDFDGTKYFTFVRSGMIVWKGSNNAWYNGSGTNNSPALEEPYTQGASGTVLALVDSEDTSNHPVLNSDTEVGCLWITENSKLTIENNAKLQIIDSLQLDGEIRFVGDAQLIQKHNGTSKVGGNGKIYRDQQSTVPNVYRYNYWSSPVVEAAGGTTYSVGAVMKDGSTPTSENSTPKDIVFSSSGYDGSTNPTTIANYWIWSFVSGSSGSDWQLKRDTGTLNRGEGYTMKSTGVSDQNYTFVGTPNDGTITITVAENTNSLIGNPYPGELDIVQFITDNTDPENNNTIDGTLYFWEHKGESATTTITEGHNIAGYIGGYSTRNLVMGVAASSPTAGTSGTGNEEEETYTYTAPGTHVAVGQGFFVGALDGIGTNAKIIFNNGQRSKAIAEKNESSIFLKGKAKNLKETIKQLPKLKIGFEYENQYQAKLHRQIGISFREGSTFDFENGLDSYLYDLQATDAYWQFSEKQGKYNIACVPKLTEELTVPISFSIGEEGCFKLIIDEKENINYQIFLEDKITGNMHDLEKPVLLNLASGTYTDRFQITFKNTNTEIDLGTGAIENSFKYAYDDNFKVINLFDMSTTNNVSEIQITNLLGEIVLKNKLPIHGKISVKNIPSGIYILQLKTNQGLLKKKIIIH